MNKPVSSGLNVGIAILGLGILLSIGGLMGQNWAQNAEQRYSRRVKEEREAVQKQLLGDGMRALMARLEEIGPIRILDVTEETTGLILQFQPPLEQEINSFLTEFEEQLWSEIPGVPHVVEVSLNVAGPAPDYIHTELIAWSKGSPGLSKEEVEDPKSYGIGRNYGSEEYRRYADIFLTVPGTRELRLHFQRDDVPSVLNRLSAQFPHNVRPHVSGDGYVLESYFKFQVYDNLASSNRFLLSLTTILDRLSKLGFLLLFIGPTLGVVLDAQRRRLPAMLWGLFVLPTSALGMLIYTLVNRDVGPVCPECGERISARFVVCPYCQTELKGTCPTCGHVVGLSWHYCPSCSTQL